MGYGVQLPKYAHPDFADIDKIPVNAEIDWNHPLVKTFKLKKFLYFADGVPTDLVTGRTASFVSDSGGSGVVGAGRDGLRAECSSAGFDATDFGMDVFTEAKAGLTVCCRVTYNDATKDHGLFDHITGAGTIRVWADTSGGELRAGYFGPSPAVYGRVGIITAGERHTWGLTVSSPGGNYEFCYDNDTSDSLSTSYTAPSGSLTSSYFAKTTETSKDSDADYDFIALFSRPIPVQIFESFLKNPFQILKPRSESLFYVVTGAPPVGNGYPVINQYYRTLLSGGM